MNQIWILNLFKARYSVELFSFFIFYRFLESLKIVRKKHCVAFRRSSEAGLNRVSQLDMALAQFGFMGFTLLGGDYLGVNNNFEELEGLIHFWRVIGSMLGMEDKFVHCIFFRQKLFFSHFQFIYYWLSKIWIL